VLPLPNDATPRLGCGIITAAWKSVNAAIRIERYGGNLGNLGNVAGFSDRANRGDLAFWVVQTGDFE
jgi:hypothetical protein